MIIFENLLSCFAPAEQFLTDYYFDTICTAVVYYVKNIDRRFKWWHFTFFLSNILDSKKSFAYYLTSNIWKYLNQIKWRNWICFFFRHTNIFKENLPCKYRHLKKCWSLSHLKCYGRCLNNFVYISILIPRFTILIESDLSTVTRNLWCCAYVGMTRGRADFLFEFFLRKH